MPSQPNLRPNTISRIKRQSESDFRVHFTLMNVKWKKKPSSNEQLLVECAVDTISKHCRPHIVQIASVIDDEQFDISVGLFNDVEAYNFLRSHVKVKMTDGFKEWEYEPVVSRVFQSYINNRQRSDDTFTRIETEPPAPNSTHYQQNSAMEDERVEMQKQTSRKQEPEPIKIQPEVQEVWAFGIPKQYSAEDVKNSLHILFNLSVALTRWKLRQTMEYLEIQLAQPITKAEVQQLEPHIDHYPYVIMPACDEGQIMRELAKFTIEIVIKESEDDEEAFAHMMNDIGGVCVMMRSSIKDKDDHRYVVVFNNVNNAQKACNNIKYTRRCTAEHKKYEFKLGRINKFFTFRELINQMQQYQ